MLKLEDYDIVIVNSSGGKDSLVALWRVISEAKRQNYSREKIVVSHQDLGKMEWPGTKELVLKQAELFGLKTYFSKRRDKTGYEETLIEYVLRRGKWPSRGQRYCTSDFKRGPGARIVTMLTKEMGRCRVLYVFGFRAEESPDRSKKKKVSLNKRLTTKKRTVVDWLPIHRWKTKDVWGLIRTKGLPYHYAYDLGMPRLSCVFCIFSPFDALVVAGKANPELLEKYIEVEETIGHSFKNGFSISEVKVAIDEGYNPRKVQNWIM